jgi:hypothetical protein
MRKLTVLALLSLLVPISAAEALVVDFNAKTFLRLYTAATEAGENIVGELQRLRPKPDPDCLCRLYLSIPVPVFFSPVHNVLTFGHDHGRLVHAILEVRASLLFLAGGRIPRVA